MPERRGPRVIAGLVPFGRVEKAELAGETTGFIEYVAERDTHRLLGCHVVGHQAADLVYDAVVVMRAQGLIDDLAVAVGVFPTVQEAMEGAARAVLRKAAPEEVSRAARHGETRRRWELMALTCPACGGEFESQDQLDAHTRADHGGGFRCPACGAEFESQEQLDEHSRAEHGA